MLLIGPPIPSICITLAPPERVHPDPYSPFPSEKPDVEDDGYRANRLSLPPSLNSFPWHPSPLRPADLPPPQGLTPDQLTSLLKVSRDQRAKFASQKDPDLRKELAHKSQALRQLERRARFLSRVNGPSCTATTSIPEVSLETPLPHESKFEHSNVQTGAENLDLVVISSADPAWDEQIEHGLIVSEQPHASSKVPLATPNKSERFTPSLDEITARLKPVDLPFKKDGSRSRLPNFLKALGLSSGPTEHQTRAVPVRSLALNDEIFDITTTTQQVIRPEHPNPCSLTLGPRGSVVSHRVDVVVGPTMHVSRADTARDMIVTLRRRSSPPPGGPHECTQTSAAMKRRSAPAQLQHSGRVGFDHGAVLRGGF